MKRWALPILPLAAIAFLVGPLAIASGGNYAVGLVPAAQIEAGAPQVWTATDAAPTGAWALPTGGAGITQANILYVATNGSDSNNCSIGSPCATYAHCVSVFGSTCTDVTPCSVSVAPGDYTENIQLAPWISLDGFSASSQGQITTAFGGTLGIASSFSAGANGAATNLIFYGSPLDINFLSIGAAFSDVAFVNCAFDSNLSAEGLGGGSDTVQFFSSTAQGITGSDADIDLVSTFLGAPSTMNAPTYGSAFKGRSGSSLSNVTLNGGTHQSEYLDFGAALYGSLVLSGANALAEVGITGIPHNGCTASGGAVCASPNYIVTGLLPLPNIDPTGSSSGQVVTSTGPTTAPVWGAGGGGGFSVTGTGFPWFNSGSPLSAAQQLSGNVTLGTPSAGFVPATVTGAQGNVLTFGTSGTVTWAGTDSAAGFIQNATTNVTTVPIQFLPQTSLNVNGNGSIVQFFDSLPAGSGAQGGFEFSTVGAANDWLAPVGTGADDLFLHVSSRTSSNYSAASDGTNLILNAPGGGNSTIQLRSGDTSLMGMFEITGGAGHFWVLPGGVSPIGNNQAIVSDGATFTSFISPSSLDLITNGSIAEYMTPNGVILNGATSNFSGGTGVITITNDTVAPTAAASAGTVNIYSLPSTGLAMTGPASAFDEYVFAPVTQGAVDTQQPGTFNEKRWITTTSATPIPVFAIPVPVANTCAGFYTSGVSRLSTAVTGAAMINNYCLCCYDGTSLNCQVQAGPSPAIGSGGGTGSMTCTASGVNGLVTVASGGVATDDWTATVQGYNN